MSDQVSYNKYGMPWPYSMHGWAKCEGNTHKSVFYVCYGLHIYYIDLVCESWIITQFGQPLPDLRQSYCAGCFCANTQLGTCAIR